MLKLIDTKLSGNAWKVRLALRFLELEFTRETMNLAEGKHKQAAFQAVNPLQRVPVLQVETGEHLFESNAILIYLANGTDLLPSDPIEQAKVHAWMFFEQADLMRFLAFPRFFAMIGKQQENAEIISQYQDLAKAGLARVDAALEQTAWIAGSAVTIADIALYPYIRLAPEGGLDLDQWGNIQRWLGRFEGLPNYEPLVTA